MRVGIDGACWLNRRGYGRFTRELVAAMVPLDRSVEYTLLFDFDAADAPPAPEGVRVVRIPTRRPGARSAAADGRRSLRDLWLTSRAISRERFDVVFFPSAYTYVPVTGPGRIAVVIHDVIAEELPQQVFATRRAAAQWRLKLLAARAQADLVVTVSEASRQGIARRFGITAQRMLVISEAANGCFRPLPHDQRMLALLARLGLVDQRFVLYVGGISPHKNLAALLDAFAALRAQPEYADYRLVLAGDFSGDVFYSAHAALRQQSARLHLDGTVCFTGYVEDEDLALLYNAAAAFVLPSLQEGFGLPAIEALACGTPVLVSARGALPEIVAEAGLLFEPERPGELLAALQRITGDGELRANLRQRGPQRAAQFRWERAGQDLLHAFYGLHSGVAAAPVVAGAHPLG
ncbi:MAG: glycosyltransferase family 4 protein [Deltaproteobacteria bacterium]|nr:glycosyltransferase family 4 protein [Deltaproteobacteria bacterium]